MAIKRDPELEALEAAEEWQAQERALDEAARKRDHDYRLARMKAVAANRHKVWLVLIKVPVYIVIVSGMVLLQLFNRPIPEAFTKFLDN